MPLGYADANPTYGRIRVSEVLSVNQELLHIIDNIVSLDRVLGFIQSVLHLFLCKAVVNTETECFTNAIR